MAAPILVANLKVRAKANRIYTLTWDANPELDIDHYDIYRSEANFTDFIQINTAPVVGLTYDDHVPVTAPPDLIWWYKVVAVNTSSGVSDLSTSESESTFDEQIFVRTPFVQTVPQPGEVKPVEPGNTQTPFVNYQTLPDLKRIEQKWMLEIRRRYTWLLQAGGTKCKLFKRKWSGTKCPNWDALRKIEDPSPSDTICYGTGFVGGYHTPIDITVSFVSPTATSVRSMEFGHWFEFQPKNWTLWEPNLLDRDLIVNTVTGERFEITSVTKTSWRGLTLRQNFETRKLETTSVIYKIPII